MMFCISQDSVLFKYKMFEGFGYILQDTIHSVRSLPSLFSNRVRLMKINGRCVLCPTKNTQTLINPIPMQFLQLAANTQPYWQPHTQLPIKLRQACSQSPLFLWHSLISVEKSSCYFNKTVHHCTEKIVWYLQSGSLFC